MRFNLKPGDTFCDGRSKSVAVKINDRETIHLPSTSYIFDQDHFIISSFRHNPMESILTDLSQGLQLKLEKIEDDYKLALVNNSGQYYYSYYYDPNTTKMATFDSIPKNYIEDRGQEYITSYSDERYLVDRVPLINSKVLIDPKDIMSSKDIDLILKELENSPDKRLRIRTGENFLTSYDYKSVELYNSSNYKIGILNNIAASFNDTELLLSSENTVINGLGTDLDLKRTNPRFRIKRLNNDNYVGCILSEYGKCERFYALIPGSFERGEYVDSDYNDDYDDGSSDDPLYPYYYYLHGLEVSMNHKKIEELEQRIENLEERVENLQLDIKPVVAMPGPRGDPGLPGVAGMPGLDGRPGEKGEQGHTGPRGELGSRGDPGTPGSPGLDGKPRGPKGEKGEAGDPQGPKGDKGMPGLSIKGDIGPQGPSGAKGDKGNEGPKGSSGPTGAIGPLGPQGPEGKKGELGKVGPSGPRGWKGEKGELGVGVQGPIGLNGTQGLQGLKGDKGDQGIQGSVGIKGEIGSEGKKGN